MALSDFIVADLHVYYELTPVLIHEYETRFSGVRPQTETLKESGFWAAFEHEDMPAIIHDPVTMPRWI
eukprot:COSAG02_NODE_13359_length_1404_cov_4.305747_1_plen_68_part_00